MTYEGMRWHYDNVTHGWMNMHGRWVNYITLARADFVLAFVFLGMINIDDKWHILLSPDTWYRHDGVFLHYMDYQKIAVPDGSASGTGY